eukprot:gnl/TRDRNA2_/TRDRNA2_182109_c0_seq1.p1 gnl/TRDRNA2_/TRDRNA2_182109_c0~~gnl/TRDRNA2_/TRDRNA2_182109_c0_seq1.p1  ORF type:complete len:177 (-),score=44.45 gnl/TRDRNA2_/TRDRNA2_182109_c0_seq1:174-680(-)
MAEGATYEGLTESQLVAFKEAFNIWDKQQHQHIPWADFAGLWRSIGQNPTDKDIADIIAANDTGTGYFDVDRFLRICESDNPRWLKDEVHPDTLIECFRSYDKEGTGLISVPRFRYMLQCMGDKLDEIEADALIELCVKEQGIDVNAGEELNYERIVDELMTKNPTVN